MHPCSAGPPGDTALQHSSQFLDELARYATLIYSARRSARARAVACACTTTRCASEPASQSPTAATRPSGVMTSSFPSAVRNRVQRAAPPLRCRVQRRSQRRGSAGGERRYQLSHMPQHFCEAVRLINSVQVWARAVGAAAAEK